MGGPVLMRRLHWPFDGLARLLCNTREYFIFAVHLLGRRERETLGEFGFCSTVVSPGDVSMIGQGLMAKPRTDRLGWAVATVLASLLWGQKREQQATLHGTKKKITSEGSKQWPWVVLRRVLTTLFVERESRHRILLYRRNPLQATARRVANL